MYDGGTDLGQHMASEKPGECEIWPTDFHDSGQTPGVYQLL